MSIISHYRERYNGNIVEQYTETMYRCDRCYGSGIIEYDYDKMIEQLNSITDREKRKKIIKKWKATNSMPCPDCDGRGEWIERR